MYQTIRYEKENHIGILTINRPQALNALSSQVIEEIELALEVCERDTELRALIITGSGKAFVAGADIAEMCSMNIMESRDYSQRGSHMMRRLEQLAVPTIAAVNGFALGGGTELALACDIILASEKAQFGQPEVGLGIIPGCSGTQRLPRRIGLGKAKELIYTGRRIKANEAKAIGLVNEVYTSEYLMDAAKELAAEIARQAPVAVRLSKSCINRGMQMDIDNAIALENDNFSVCFSTQDQKAGMTAFLAKAKEPVQFKGE